MAEAGTYLCVVRQDADLPQVNHSSIRKNTPEAHKELTELALEIFHRTGDRIPFTVAELRLSPEISAGAVLEPRITPETLAQALCDAMPHPGGGSQIVYEDALEAASVALHATRAELFSAEEDR